MSSWANLFLLLVGAALSACTTPPNASRPLTPARTVALLTGPSTEETEARVLAAKILALSPAIEAQDANRVATCAYRTARQLTVEYSIVGPAVFHNFLINVGLKKRGLCYQWAQDLIARLDALPLHSLELRWGVAHRGGLREHNCVVLTAHGQPFAEGIVLDCWRNAGRLYYGPVKGDRYPWEEEDWDWRATAPPLPNSR